MKEDAELFKLGVILREIEIVAAFTENHIPHDMITVNSLFTLAINMMVIEKFTSTQIEQVLLELASKIREWEKKDA
jgi:hypothetical protein